MTAEAPAAASEPHTATIQENERQSCLCGGSCVCCYEVCDVLCRPLNLTICSNFDSPSALTSPYTSPLIFIIQVHFHI